MEYLSLFKIDRINKEVEAYQSAYHEYKGLHERHMRENEMVMEEYDKLRERTEELLEENMKLREEIEKLKDVQKNGEIIWGMIINSLWPADSIRWHRYGSTLAQVCLTATSHYLNQYWLIIRQVLWLLPESKFTECPCHISQRWMSLSFNGFSQDCVIHLQCVKRDTAVLH